MPIKMTTAREAIARHLTEQIYKRRSQLIGRLQYLGERCVNEARDLGSYTDRTGNLRASIGYVVMLDGTPVAESGGEGAKSALSRAVAESPQEGLCLVVVAGMHYAHYVAARGFDVLDSAEHLAEVEMPKILDKLKIQWKRK